MKTKEYIKALAEYASECQINADEMASKLINQNEIFSTISVVQSICNFNLSWLYQISPEVFLHLSTLKFLADNLNNFKRKLTIKEIIRIDGILKVNEINSFNDFKTKYVL